MKPALEIRTVSYAFGKRQVLKDVSFFVAPGLVTMLLGPNGAGKTTLFSLIARLLELQSGQIVGERSKLGVVFQQPAVDLELTVAQNLNYYAALHGLSKHDAARKIEELLGPLDLGTRKTEKVRNLNGGHRRRLEIARALIASPTLLLLDEPTTGLDILTRQALVSFLHGQAQERNIGVLWTTHLVDEVLPQDHMVLLRAGVVMADGNADDIMRSSKTKSIAEAFTYYAGPAT